MRCSLGRKGAALDLAGAVYAEGREIDLEPAWFDVPGGVSIEAERRSSRRKRVGCGDGTTNTNGAVVRR